MAVVLVGGVAAIPKSASAAYASAGVIPLSNYDFTGDGWKDNLYNDGSGRIYVKGYGGYNYQSWYVGEYNYITYTNLDPYAGIEIIVRSTDNTLSVINQQRNTRIDYNLRPYASNGTQRFDYYNLDQHLGNEITVSFASSPQILALSGYWYKPVLFNTQYYATGGIKFADTNGQTGNEIIAANIGGPVQIIDFARSGPASPIFRYYTVNAGWSSMFYKNSRRIICGCYVSINSVNYGIELPLAQSLPSLTSTSTVEFGSGLIKTWALELIPNKACRYFNVYSFGEYNTTTVRSYARSAVPTSVTASPWPLK